MEELRATIRTYLTDEFGADLDAPVTDTTPLIEREIMDSTGILMVIGFLEDEFDIYIDADDVSVDHFRTVTSIAALVAEKQAEGS
jgi:acyl carrier protein